MAKPQGNVIYQSNIPQQPKKMIGLNDLNLPMMNIPKGQTPMTLAEMENLVDMSHISNAPCDADQSVIKGLSPPMALNSKTQVLFQQPVIPQVQAFNNFTDK